ncbi:MAG: single-stranded DNA-binding protein, partial [Desulfuromonadales bacterium]|nr:single-stranded DNA-binding protein [Desulfuromonadales bacterium]
DGNKRYITEIVANEMQMLSRAGDQGGGSGGGSGRPTTPTENFSSAPQEPPFNPDDDIPF